MYAHGSHEIRRSLKGSHEFEGSFNVPDLILGFLQCTDDRLEKKAAYE